MSPQLAHPEEARELNELWEIAGDLESILDQIVADIALSASAL
jgi:hypothetical protein